MGTKSNCWLHRVNHEGGLEILKKEKKLTIGYSDVAADDDAVHALENGDYAAFCRAYERIYGGEIWRIRNNLWRFVVEMNIDDKVVVPYPWGFTVCLITGEAVKCNYGDRDLGWSRSVEILAAECSPRDAYATSTLLGRMKFRGTNCCISDLAKDVEDAVARLKEKRPFCLAQEVCEPLLEVLRGNGYPEALEGLVANFLEAQGAEVEILPKNYSGKLGDCDVRATFPLLHQVILVQCKKHEGITDGWGVQQICEFPGDASGSSEMESVNRWVVSLADDFDEDAKVLAKAKNVILITGRSLCRMLLASGIR